MRICSPLTGTTVMFPRVALLETGKGNETGGRSRLEVDKLLLNHDIQHSQFILEPPWGTEVSVFSAGLGDSPRRYLAGGQPAVEAALAQRAEETRRELERLAEEGIQVDARPPGRNRWPQWLLGFGLFCLAFVSIMIIRRRRAA